MYTYVMCIGVLYIEYIFKNYTYQLLNGVLDEPLFVLPYSRGSLKDNGIASKRNVCFCK